MSYITQILCSLLILIWLEFVILLNIYNFIKIVLHPLFCLDSSDLISKLGTEPLTTDTVDASEKFLCLIYKTLTAKTTDEARSILFRKAVKPDDLPPTSDAAKQHIRRVHF